MIVTNEQPMIISLLVPILLLFGSSRLSSAHDLDFGGIRQRTLMGFKETPNGGNITFDCSPSGPCIPCSRPEKKDEKYRCGETGYRIRLKCVPSKSDSKDDGSVKPQKTRSLLEEMDTLGQRSLRGASSKSYTTYRSCIPAANEEKLSVLGFEALMLALMAGSGSFIYFRRKRVTATQGGAPVRIPTSSRF